jgi:AraC family transcriptional regulator
LLFSAFVKTIPSVVVSVPTNTSAVPSRRTNVRPGPHDCWILHECARQYYWKGAGLLSIKTFFGGSARYQSGRGFHSVDESSYLVLNHGQSYAINIDSPRPVESFCIFFPPGFLSQILQSLSLCARRLLDHPADDTPQHLCLFEKNYAHDQILSPALFRLRSRYQTLEGGGLLEQFHDLAERLLSVHNRVLRETERLNSVRPATRHELYRRVSLARDYLHAMFAEPITLAHLARIACLSQNHLLRTFRQIYGETPHQFLVRRRLTEARRLLAHTQTPVTQVCMAVGFESLGSFSTLFRRRSGLSPAEYRRAKK